MFGLFKKKNKNNNRTPKLLDLNNQPLQNGDFVISLRYDLGKCLVRTTESGLEYESVETGEVVSWVKMIDASTDNQKVKKIIEDQTDGDDQGKPEEK